MYKQLIVLILAFVAIGCKQEQKETPAKTEAVVKEITSEKTDVSFPVYNFDGLAPILNKKDGKTYIVNFWATWCKPCVEELPAIEKIYSDYKSKNVELILVSLDMPSMWKSKLEPFVAEQQLKGKVIILDDPKMNDWIPQIDPDWEGGIPASLLYNADKRQFYPHGFTYDALEKELLKFLN